MFSRILVPVDGSPTATLDFSEAIKLAKDQGGTLRLIHVVNEFIMTSPYEPGLGVGQVLDGVRENGKPLLQEPAAIVRSAGIEVAFGAC